MNVSQGFCPSCEDMSHPAMGADAGEEPGLREGPRALERTGPQADWLVRTEGRSAGVGGVGRAHRWHVEGPHLAPSAGRWTGVRPEKPDEVACVSGSGNGARKL